MNAASRFLSPLLAVLAGCTPTWQDTTVDQGIDIHELSQLQAEIWVDPEGCDHWIIDDGLEGYMDPRRRPDGTPVCRPGAVPETIYSIEEAR